MQKLIAGLSVIAVLSVALVAANITLDPPLRSEKQDKSHYYARTRQLSEPAIAGQMTFGNMCAGCHGESGQGTASGPALNRRPYAVDFRDSELFHSEIARDIPAHQAIKQAARGSDALSFNMLEKMAKFLREMRRNADG